jgi:hypothetical protein
MGHNAETRFETPHGDTIRILLSSRYDDDRNLLELSLTYRRRLAESLDIRQSGRERICLFANAPQSSNWPS